METIKSENELIGQTYRTTYHWLKKDFLLFEREHQFSSSPHVETDAFGSFWMLWLFRAKKGEVAVSRMGLQNMEGDFALLLPPFSIVEWHIRAKTLNWQGYVWSEKAASLVDFSKFKKATLFRQVFKEKPESQIEIFEKISAEQPLMIIEKEESGDLNAKEIKNYLDHHFDEELKISEVAKLLKYKNYEIGRIFKKEYGINPVTYLQKLRVMNAIHSMLFLNPDKVSTVAFENGFSDLSRFNKNFLKLSRSTPSQHMKVAPR